MNDPENQNQVITFRYYKGMVGIITEIDYVGQKPRLTERGFATVLKSYVISAEDALMGIDALKEKYPLPEDLITNQ